MAESIEDPFIKVWFDEQDPAATKEGSDFYEEWRQLGTLYLACILVIH